MSTVLYDPIKAMAKVTDSVIVAFSGGKESVVTLDLCTRYFKNVKAFFMYIVPDLSFQERTMEWYEKRYQIEIMRIPHMDVCEFYHYGSFRPEDPTFPIVSINDIYQYVRLETDTWWIAAGERIDDSIVRRAMMKKIRKYRRSERAFISGFGMEEAGDHGVHQIPQSLFRTGQQKTRFFVLFVVGKGTLCA